MTLYGRICAKHGWQFRKSCTLRLQSLAQEICVRYDEDKNFRNITGLATQNDWAHY